MSLPHADRPAFNIVLRGYDRDEVDALMTGLEENIATLRRTDGEPPTRTLSATDAETAHQSLGTVWRGYNRAEVDTHLSSMIATLRRLEDDPQATVARTSSRHPTFPTVLRGYAPTEVEDLIVRLDASLCALRSGNGSTVLITASDAEAVHRMLPVQLRGIDRRQVDCHVTSMIAELARLEGRVGH
ncbi:hypothetical protein RIF23_16435 [Lipingzhangella sp. LS1_29]|uniref:DivIVA domain-containing protein n=1 Tax=Lipingzhangella rawalii TaxID=2055835 RepID=A0ABU2H9B6_9ACTN|nr:hypothetical protein [Lipingzhangella rawalii]MDS1271881.1 hypothetical protein [Lipingzhangella rawalii]